MVKIDLITGFLGSGKTTFLLKYARYLMEQGLKIGILEYDYGAINIDMVLLRELQGDRCTLEMLAAACDEDCLARRFKTKLIAMAMSGYDRVIIEPSGVFDMDLFFDTLRDEPLENWYEIGTVITVVDANYSAMAEVSSDYHLVSQAASAGSIILSKLQLTAAAAVDSTKEYIEQAAGKLHCRNFTPNYIEKNWEEFDAEDYKKITNSGYHIVSCDKSIAGGNSEFSSVSFLDVKPGLEEFKTKLQQLFEDEQYGNVLRIKGFIKDADGKGYLVNAIANNYNIEQVSKGQGTVIVIGSELNKKAIEELILS